MKIWVSYEKLRKNETDSKKADGVIYLNSEIIAVIELKDTKTKNLDKVQQQAFWYLTPEFLNFFIIESRIPNSWYLQRL